MCIWLDVTTTLAWNRPALGIVRVEAEVARYFSTYKKKDVRYCRFDNQQRSYFEVPRDVLNVALKRLDSGGDHSEIEQSHSQFSHTSTLKKLFNSLVFTVKEFVRRAGRYVPVCWKGSFFLKGLSCVRGFCNAWRRQLDVRLARSFPTSEAGCQAASHAESLLLSCMLPRNPIQPFERGDIYISLGLDWDQKDMEFLYALKQQLCLKVLLFCYDIIPILFPEYCVANVAKKFPEYFVDAAWCADKILCISQCSRRDLRSYLGRVGAPIPDLDVVRLGGNILAKTNDLPSATVRDVCGRRFILYVSTIEGRKNHDVLYRAYNRLLDDGHYDLPLLVFVGMQGWGVESLIQALHSDMRMKPYIRVFEHISDGDLVHLYLNSEFTVYPSLYEGWGLPVAESLAYGKFCLASSAASIPEVGGDLLEYVDPYDERAWASRLLWYVQNPDVLKARQSKIVEMYHHSLWEETGAAVFVAAEALVGV